MMFASIFVLKSALVYYMSAPIVLGDVGSVMRRALLIRYSLISWVSTNLADEH